MKVEDCIAVDQTAFLVDIHTAIQEGPGRYQCTVPEGVRIIATAFEINRLFPEVEAILLNEEEGTILLTTIGRPTIH